MTNFFNKSANALANLAVLAVCVVMASFGFALLTILATVGLFAMGLALIAAPFISDDAQAQDDTPEAAAA